MDTTEILSSVGIQRIPWIVHVYRISLKITWFIGSIFQLLWFQEDSRHISIVFLLLINEMESTEILSSVGIHRIAWIVQVYCLSQKITWFIGSIFLLFRF